ncbi:MAG: hypothetical protein ACYDBV_11585 [Nitrospiria bacterium]
MLKLDIPESSNIIGFAAENTLPGRNQIKVATRNLITSDDPLFYTYIKQITNLFLHPNNISPNYISQFLIVIHTNNTTDLYINDQLKTSLEVAAKKNIQKGEIVMSNDIADIRRLKFEDAQITEDDKVVCCIKVGWKFGLFFDLGRPSSKLEIDKMMLSLGDLYRYLSFEHVYKILESESLSKKMFEDGWFPFIEIIAADYEILSEAYKAQFDLDNKVNKVVESFNQERIKKMTEKWWLNPVFKGKQVIIEAGIKAFLQNERGGFINCIKTLGTEIEGILRKQYLDDTGTAQGGIQTLIQHITDKGKNKAGSESSLLLPEYFLKHLKENVFAHFDPQSIMTETDIPISRHSVSHGAAAANAYTKIKALQTILALDQIHFYSKRLNNPIFTGYS